MKLVFKRDKDQNLLAYIKEGTTSESFTYVKMIKSLLSNNHFEPSDFDKTIVQADRDRINSMLTRINKAITAQENE
jgi:hypothetical protein